MSTIFNKIIRGEIPAHIIYEDDSVIAFLDISQATVGHTLVVPKGRYENIYDLDDEIAGHLYRVVVLIANGIKKSLKPEGINILNNNGSSYHTPYYSGLQVAAFILGSMKLQEFRFTWEVWIEMNDN